MALFSVRAIIKIVSSPASVPTMPSQCMASKAAHIPWAIPFIHFTATMFPAKSIDRTESENRVKNFAEMSIASFFPVEYL